LFFPLTILNLKNKINNVFSMTYCFTLLQTLFFILFKIRNNFFLVSSVLSIFQSSFYPFIYFFVLLYFFLLSLIGLSLQKRLRPKRKRHLDNILDDICFYRFPSVLETLNLNPFFKTLKNFGHLEISLDNPVILNFFLIF